MTTQNITEVEATPVIDRQITEALATFSPTDAGIAELAQKAHGIQIGGIEDRTGYDECHSVRMEVKNTRVGIERTRKELKADALKYGRAVDAEAKRITFALLEIEEPLHAQQKLVDAEIEAIQNAAAVAEREAAEATERARLEAEAAERAAEAAKLAEERKALDAERAAAQAERDKIDAERRELEHAKAVEAAKAQAIADERDRVERERSAAAVQAAKDAEAAAKRAQEATDLKAKRDAARPDAEKIRALANYIADIDAPEIAEVPGTRVAEILNGAERALFALAHSLDGGQS
jgi:chromosome segregation ATPase